MASRNLVQTTVCKSLTYGQRKETCVNSTREARKTNPNRHVQKIPRSLNSRVGVFIAEDY